MGLATSGVKNALKVRLEHVIENLSDIQMDEFFPINVIESMSSNSNEYMSRS